MKNVFWMRKLCPSNKKYGSKIGVFPKPRVKNWLKFSHFFFLLHQLIDSKKENQVGTYSIANISANFVRVKKCICMIVITKQVWQKHKPGEQIHIEKVEERKKNSVIDVSSSKDSRTQRKIQAHVFFCEFYEIFKNTNLVESVKGCFCNKIWAVRALQNSFTRVNYWFP